ncbi:uncharacterized protein MONOS_10816 [Monocercomonoides exilis]|uniref:uncharacterized protein n=1 Tax=Monocercomonoides exilis TaxID=2049356 RepID=UPI003559D562|nr:hypothetical protein MONOS_10816 [Monocercomonoides exilis]|eukprot:MONOS_10816.1-p1 / transcript=MONOS_10816.1 / gene=MONOS_10816 / organism=Monocercomonoides_exilis_PA203 / gene_product=unspecified product / transcript_product=unspecified product / location=Mono_scaffold00507:14872-18966(+) / protein_length=1087 / sequence_SO=supercontig / SO=protein_coding / is_pseudo=false
MIFFDRSERAEQRFKERQQDYERERSQKKRYQDNESLRADKLPNDVQNLLSPDPELQYQSCKSISQLLGISRESAILLSNLNAIRSIVHLLANENFPPIQLEACNILVGITANSQSDVDEIIKAGGVVNLMNLLFSKHDVIVESAVLAIGNMCACSQNALNSFLSMKITSQIVYFFKSQSENVIRNTLFACCQLCQRDVKYERVEPILKPMSMGLYYADVKILNLVLCAFQRLTCDAEMLVDILHLQILKQLFKLLHHPTLYVVAPTLKILCNFSRGSFNVTTPMLRCGLIRTLSQMLCILTMGRQRFEEALDSPQPQDQFKQPLFLTPGFSASLVTSSASRETNGTMDENDTKSGFSPESPDQAEPTIKVGTVQLAAQSGQQTQMGLSGSAMDSSPGTFNASVIPSFSAPLFNSSASQHSSSPFVNQQSSEQTAKQTADLTLVENTQDDFPALPSPPMPYAELFIPKIPSAGKSSSKTDSMNPFSNYSAASIQPFPSASSLAPPSSASPTPSELSSMFVPSSQLRSMPAGAMIIFETSLQLQKDICWLLSNIAAGTRREQNAVIRSGLIPLFVLIMRGRQFEDLAIDGTESRDENEASNYARLAKEYRRHNENDYSFEMSDSESDSSDSSEEDGESKSDASASRKGDGTELMDLLFQQEQIKQQQQTEQRPLYNLLLSSYSNPKSKTRKHKKDSQSLQTQMEGAFLIAKKEACYVLCNMISMNFWIIDNVLRGGWDEVDIVEAEYQSKSVLMKLEFEENLVRENEQAMEMDIDEDNDMLLNQSNGADGRGGGGGRVEDGAGIGFGASSMIHNEERALGMREDGIDLSDSGDSLNIVSTPKSLFVRNAMSTKGPKKAVETWSLIPPTTSSFGKRADEPFFAMSQSLSAFEEENGRNMLIGFGEMLELCVKTNELNLMRQLLDALLSVFNYNLFLHGKGDYCHLKKREMDRARAFLHQHDMAGEGYPRANTMSLFSTGAETDPDFVLLPISLWIQESSIASQLALMLEHPDEQVRRMTENMIKRLRSSFVAENKEMLSLEALLCITPNDIRKACQMSRRRMDERVMEGMHSDERDDESDEETEDYEG